MSKFHQSQAWTNLRARAVAAARKADAPCPVCGHPIDWTASGDDILASLTPERRKVIAKITDGHRSPNETEEARMAAAKLRAS